MSWYSEGAEAADELAASMITRRRRNFYTDQKKQEKATIRFLKPAGESFNYKRAFVKHAKGEKMLTSPGTIPDPFVEAGYSLQASFAWPIIDRRVIKFEDSQTGEEKEVGPRVLYFADGRRAQKQLIAFERDMLEAKNEELTEEGKTPLSLEEYNLTHYDIQVSKAQKAPWNFIGKRAKPLSADDQKLIEDNPLDLAEELKPLEPAELKAVLRGSNSSPTEESDATTYSYEPEGETKEDEVIEFA